MEIKHVLLIGGTGVLSREVATQIVKAGHKVTMINRGHRPIPKGCELIKSDRLDYENIKSHLDGKIFDAVCDFLCYNTSQLERSYKFYQAYTGQYIFISSCEVYDHSKGLGFSENGPKSNKEWDYSVDKWAAEMRLMELSKEFGTPYTVIRPGITYDDTRIPYGIAPLYGYHWTLVSRAKSKKPIITWNNGFNFANIMRVEDFAEGFAALVGNPLSHNQAYNICGDETPTYGKVLESVEKATGVKIPTIDIDTKFYANLLGSKHGELLAGRGLNQRNSNEKLKSICPGWSQLISIEEGIAMTIGAYKSQNFEKGIDWIFDAKTDKIIYLWCKKNNIDYKDLNLKFVDYLGTASIKDRKNYYLERYNYNPIVKFVQSIDIYYGKFMMRVFG